MEHITSDTQAQCRQQVGPRLQSLRKARGLTLRALAAQARVTTSQLSDMEHGRGLPSCVTLCRLADALGVLVDEVLGRVPMPATSPDELRARVELLGVWMREAHDTMSRLQGQLRQMEHERMLVELKLKVGGGPDADAH